MAESAGLKSPKQASWHCVPPGQGSERVRFMTFSNMISGGEQLDLKIDGSKLLDPEIQLVNNNENLSEV